MTITDQQRVYLETRRKLSPPTVYSSDRKTETVIGGDTEDALILATPESKRKAVAYLRLALDSDGGSDDHDEVLKLFADQQATVRKTLSDALTQIVSSFDGFKDGLINNGETFFAVGFAPLMSILVRGLGQVKQEADASEYYNRLAQVSKAFHGGRLTSDEQREMRSWVRAILSYP